MRERYAVVDIGTNSVKFHIGESDGRGGWNTVVDRGVVTRLGEGLEASGEIAAAPLERTIQVLGGMARDAHALGVRAIVTVGTAGMRMARNRDAVLAAIRSRTGLDVDVLAGDEEARLAYQAATAALASGAAPVLVFDTGGGSSQFTFGQGARVEERFSVNVGAVRYMETYSLGGPVAPDVIAGVMRALAVDLERLEGHGRRALVGIGGAITTMAAVAHGMREYNSYLIQGTVLTRSEAGRQIDLYAGLNAHDRRMLAGMAPAREDIILAGACIVGAIMDRMDADSVTVSDRGLRHGVLMERFSSGHTATD